MRRARCAGESARRAAAREIPDKPGISPDPACERQSP